MAKTKTAAVEEMKQARLAAARKAWLDEENDSYHSQFDFEEDLDLGRYTRSNDGSFENGISITDW